MIVESEHYSYIYTPESSSKSNRITEQGGRTMVSVIETADDSFGEDYIIDNDDIQGVLEIFSG